MTDRLLLWPRLAACGLLVLGLAAPASAQTVPPAQSTWYLAEGATNAFFEEDILIGNPNASAADIKVTYLRAGGADPVVQQFTMPATSRRTVRVNAIAGLENTGAVSAVVECTNGLGIVVERTMYWANGAKRGGHNAPAVAAPATKWYLAEGATGIFDTFVLIANPEDKAADVTVSFLKEDGTTIAYPAFPLGPQERTNIWVNYQVPGLEATSFSTVVESTNGTKLFVERAMYFAGDGSLATPWEAGHGSAAVTGPATQWFFGEGYTVDTASLAFDTFLLLANPGTTAVEATVEFLLENDAPIVKTYQLAPTSRQSVWVDFIADRDGVLGKSAFSMRVAATGPIIAERAMYWGPQVAGTTRWHEAHNSPGVTASALAWGFAEGVQGGIDATGLPFETFFLVANPSDTALSVRVTFLREDGTGIVRNYDVAAKTRFTLPTTLFPELSNQRFAAFFEATNDVPFVAERAVYWGAGWFGGTSSTGTPFTAIVAGPPAPPDPKATSVSPAQGFTAGGTLITITGTNFRAGSTVTVGGAAATGVTVLNATTIRALTPARPIGVADIVVTAGEVSTTLASAFTYVALPQPEIFAISPATGPTGGGTDVTIDGANLGGVVAVTFGGTPAASITVVNATKVTARTPARAIGKVDVTVRTNQDLTATAVAAFEYKRMLATDNTLAFGDSNTEGVIASNCAWVITMTSQSVQCEFTTDGGYPSRLQGLLRTEYPSLSITVNNGGKGGEVTADGKARLPTVMRASNDLVVIMEGVNDLNAGYDFRSIQENLRTMVRTAKNAGKVVMLGTVLPVVTVVVDGLPYTKSDNQAIEELNRRLKIVAGEEQVILADFWASFKASSNIDGLFSGDGLHPNANGYNRMAEYLSGLIIANFDGKNPIVP